MRTVRLPTVSHFIIHLRQMRCFYRLIKEWVDICLKYVNKIKMDRYETVWANMNFS